MGCTIDAAFEVNGSPAKVSTESSIGIDEQGRTAVMGFAFEANAPDLVGKGAARMEIDADSRMMDVLLVVNGINPKAWIAVNGTDTMVSRHVMTRSEVTKYADGFKLCADHERDATTAGRLRAFSERLRR